MKGSNQRAISLPAYQRAMASKIAYLENQILNVEQDKQELIAERDALQATCETLQQEVAALRAHVAPAAPPRAIDGELVQ